MEPSNPITNDGPIFFEFSTMGGLKLDSSQTELEGEMEILDTVVLKWDFTGRFQFDVLAFLTTF